MSKTWNFKKELCGCFGKPIAENPTQHMIEAAFRHHGLDWRYIQFEVGPDDLGDAIKGFRSMGFVGGNCTIPHKVAVIEHLDRLGTSAELMGAVNCIVRDGDALVGENTDGVGFVSSVQELRDPAGQHAVIIGAGGAARAIAVELGSTMPDEVQVAAMLHDLGELALLRAIADRHLDASSWGSADFVERVAVEVRAHHESIGSLLLRAWGLDADLAKLAEYHHSPPRGAQRRREIRLRAIVVVAWAGAIRAGRGWDSGLPTPDVSRELGQLGLDLEALDRIFASSSAAVSAA